MRRRYFLTSTVAVGAAAARPSKLRAAAMEKPAALGGEPVRSASFPSWPVAGALEEQALTDVLRGGKWNRGSSVDQFEKNYAELTGARHCLATASGTGALVVALNTLGVGPGDEVIVPPYTFIATVNVVLQAGALPVFVDTDRETFQIDARKIEAAITPRTVAILPAHIGGNVADVDTILAVARQHDLPVVEDACQAHLAEWRGKKAGTYGRAGCFSFQASKNLNSGEGGAVLTDDPELIERMYAFHSNSRSRTGESNTARGLNLRLTEFQGALLLAQMTRLNQQAETRDRNAQFLTRMLSEIPGVTPAKMYPGCTRNAYHLYMFRYAPEQFSGLPRTKFLEAMRAEGILVSSGYTPLNKQPFLANTLETRGFQRIYSAAERKRWHERNHCPENDKLCGEAVWLTQTMLLGPKSDMEQIAEAVRKVRQHSGKLAQAYVTPRCRFKREFPLRLMRRSWLLLILSLSLCATEKKVITPEGGPPQVGPYSPGILAGEYLYVSGQGAAKPGGGFPASAHDQVLQCLANVRKIVEAAGLTMEHIVYTQVYLKDIGAYEQIEQAWREVFPKNGPARAVLGVAKMPTDTPVEITVVAVRDLSRKKAIHLPGSRPDASAPAAVRVGDRVYLSGFDGRDTKTGQLPGDPAAQVQAALDQMSQTLNAVSLDFRHVVFVNPYLTDQMPMGVMNEVYAKHFEFGNTPARATIKVASLPNGAHIQFTGVAVANLSKRKAIRPKNMAPSPTASPCVFADDTYYCSAKSGFIPGPNSGIYASTVETQLRQTMRNLLDGLEEAGLSLADVVATNMYLDDMEDFSRMNKVYADYFPDAPPARTTVQQYPAGERKPDARDRWPPLEQISLIAVK